MPLLESVQAPIGSSGLTFTPVGQSWSADEYNVDLASPQAAVNTFVRMRKSDGKVRASLNQLLYALYAAQWRVDAADVEGGEDHAELVRSVFMPGETSGYAALYTWQDLQRNAFLAISDGFSVQEKLWAFRPADARNVFGAIELRQSKTIQHFNLAPNGPSRLESVTQYAYRKDGTLGHIDMPADRVMVFTFQREGDSFWGESILRPAHYSWRTKQSLFKFDAIQKERMGGVFYLQAREGQTPTPAQIAEGKKMLEQFRIHQNQGLYIPSCFELKAVFPTGDGGKFWESINGHNQEIEQTMFAAWQSLGTGDKGALSVGNVQLDAMLMAYQAVAKWAEDQFSGPQGVVQLIDENFGEQEMYPRVSCESFLQMKPDRMATVLDPLLKAGVVRVDQPLRIYFREKLALPPEDPKTMEPSPNELRQAAADALAESNAQNGVKQPPGSKPAPGEGKQPAKKEALAKSAYFGDLRRPPMAHEAHTDWRGIMRYLDQKPKQIWYREVERIRDRQIQQLAALAADATEAQLAAGRIGQPELGVLSAALNVGLQDAYKAGRDSVMAEAKAARGIGKADAADLEDEYPTDPTKKQQTWILRLAQGLALGMTTKLVGEAVRAGQDAQDRNLPKDQVQLAVMDALKALSEDSVMADVAGKVSQAFTGGRVEQMQSMGPEIENVYYSAIMDDGTCDACAAMDGAELDPQNYGDSVPNPNCDWPPRCRCTAVAVWRTAAASEAA